MKRLLFLALLFCSFSAFSQVSSIVGKWKTIDDKTGEEKSIVNIYKAADGKYYGKIEKLFKDPDKKCVNCKDGNKDKPILGMVIITDMKEKGDKLDGGFILDPASGDKYYVTITYDKKSEKLKLRGAIDKLGMLGRNQYWVKAE
ncbi:MAG: DUF2147 domain-containing protein [Dysgonamonadaceae bacterium]|jgi:uncharacterized protein (DUF2147 family)|nr:DUF2147 domain-containing protein [Dysgonamonadaceae bacterium]